ncbi:hypothetical protein GF420_08885 [candidate division GN15 bacterium]|nr:hypothetical protein [candidate division GN15 bacterium]
MRAFVTAVCFACLLGGAQPTAAASATVAGEARVPLADNWLITGDTLEYPLTLLHRGGGAELLVFRSPIVADETVENQRQLRSAVDNVVDNVILTLPDARLETNTGFYETVRTGFVLEFTSTDTTVDSTLKHRLMTAIYRLPDDEQVMFTLWGKGLAGGWSGVEPSIRLMQDGFVFLGEHQEQVFVSKGSRNWALLAVGLAVIAVFVLLTRGRSRRRDERERYAERTTV